MKVVNKGALKDKTNPKKSKISVGLKIMAKLLLIWIKTEVLTKAEV